MEVLTEVLGNMHEPEWHEKLHHATVEPVVLDQWTAQKSRFLGKSAEGNEYPIALKRHTHINDGDIVYWNPETNHAVVLRLALNPVLVVDLSALASMKPEEVIRISVELGHAIGNQHWPAVVKGTKVYVPLTVDKKVMLSVMETHNIDGITYEFESGTEIIPYLAPDEIRRLFGGAGHDSHGLDEHIHATIRH
ncbi:MAG: urease accessory protein UreE [Duncaniella sp.]|nr:urease accessory protein UreE [Duncaniella sp.]